MNTNVRAPLDLDAYFTRIGYFGPTATTAATLQALHRDHALRIPFENLDVLLGRMMRLDLASLEDKLIRQRRGGYCFERNGLFAAVLEQLGFRVTRLAARVLLGTQRPLPRTHMLLRVEAEGRLWFADVGFGGWGLIEPLPLEAGVEVTQGAWTFRLQVEGEAWTLQCPQCTRGSAQYTFALDPQEPVEFEPAHHYCATHPDSRFTQALLVQLPGLHERKMLANRDLFAVDAHGAPREHIASQRTRSFRRASCRAPDVCADDGFAP